MQPYSDEQFQNSVTIAHAIEWLCWKLYTALGSEALLSFGDN